MYHTHFFFPTPTPCRILNRKAKNPCLWHALWACLLCNKIAHPEEHYANGQLYGRFTRRLHGDLTLLRRAFNQRISYFRQLQEISDSVTDAEWEDATVAMALQASLTERTT